MQEVWHSQYGNFGTFGSCVGATNRGWLRGQREKNSYYNIRQPEANTEPLTQNRLAGFWAPSLKPGFKAKGSFIIPLRIFALVSDVLWPLANKS
jgi:hypothetical protein